MNTQNAGGLRRRDERGVVLVWCAILLTLLLGMSAFAIDIAQWHLNQTRQQRAADAAALAGAVSFPGDPNTANSAAQDVVGTNGYSVNTLASFNADGSCTLTGTRTVCVGPGAQPWQYRVKVVQRVNNIFGGILGLGTATIGASATGEYLKPLSMGSPSNQFGNDPDNVSWPVPASSSASPPVVYPNFWASIEGAGTGKVQGDAYAGNACDSTTDGCQGGTNLDYTGGYYYTVDFTSGSNTTVNLQAFDPGFVNVGNFCQSSSLNPVASLPANPGIPGYPEGAHANTDWSKRFVAVTNSGNAQDDGFRYCSGDSFPGGSGTPMSTTYTVLKATLPGITSSATPVTGCSTTYPGYDPSSSNSLANLMASGGKVSGSAPAPLATYFRQWTNICSVTGKAGDEYFIHVTSDNGFGKNGFALRGVTGAGNAAAPVNIAGNTTMGIYANVGAGQLTKFYLVRLPTAARGHTLVLNFFDIGDADSVGSLQVMPPTDSNVGSKFAGNTCKWTGNTASGALGFAVNTPKAPWGNLTPITDCQITGVNGTGTTWQGQWSTVQIPIPANYSCTGDADPNGCWITINYLFQGPVHDVTSWNAYLLGDPVRLVK